ncbi:MAG: VCBS domain-containing protein [Pseudomonadota bacterium]
MAAAINKGIVTSFGNTPHAKDDVFLGLTEDSNSSVILDVMGNDNGGNAKTLWSLDNGTSVGGKSPTDLLTQDTTGSTADTSANGAKIWITSDGKVGYDISTASELFKTALQKLNVGGYLTDTFTYAIRLGNGTLSWATARVRIDGVNDPAILGSVGIGLSETNDVLSTDGKLTITDVDNPEKFIEQTGTTLTDGHGSFSIDEDGNWSYVADSAFDELNVDDTITDEFAVFSVDGTKTSVTVSITGTNDPAILSSVGIGLSETNDVLSTDGKLTITDVDNPEKFIEQTGTTLTDGHGSFSIDEDGNWSYVADSAFDELNVDDTITDEFAVFSVDGTETSVTVSITGTNDAAEFSGDSEKNILESDGGTEGVLAITDIDNSSTFQLQQDAVGSYGLFSIGENGVWTYDITSADEELVAGQIYTETFEVFSADNTKTNVTINITGTTESSTDLPLPSPIINESTSFNINYGKNVVNGIYEIKGFDSNDTLHLTSPKFGLVPDGVTIKDYLNDGIDDTSIAITYTDKVKIGEGKNAEWIDVVEDYTIILVGYTGDAGFS